MTTPQQLTEQDVGDIERIWQENRGVAPGFVEALAAHFKSQRQSGCACKIDDATDTVTDWCLTHDDLRKQAELKGYRMGVEAAAKEVDILGSMGPHDEASGWAMACADRVRALLDAEAGGEVSDA